MVERFVEKVKKHRQEHDLSTYLMWSHDVVWALTVNTLRKLGASYPRAKDIKHPMVANASVLEVFHVMCDYIYPFTNVASAYRRAYSEGVFVFNMTWYEWGQWKRAERDLWQ